MPSILKQLVYTSVLAFGAFMMPGCSHSVATNPVPGAFEYREIYLPVSNPDELHELGLNTVDEDWGLWGHNLANLLPEKPSLSVFARVEGNIDRHQFCFTSEKLYDYICDYIDDNYSRNDSINFAILPNDNDIVCLCTECVKAGNTYENASPAVDRLINKLCKRYPNHTFFTSYYATTRSVPEKPQPANAGVLVSAIDYPLTSFSTPAEEKFAELLKSWQEKSGNVYVWDYINNFDDYLTPFPVLSAMQHRLRLYRDAGVDGVFLNGSGDDFSTFSHLHKVVLARLMIDPDLDWQEELRTAALQYYPTAGHTIANYIIGQEAFADSTHVALPLYEGVEKALKSYLQADSVRQLYQNVNNHIRTAGGIERERLESLRDALSFTLLELNRIQHKHDNSAELLQNLDNFPRQHTEYYNEALWPIATYIGNYEVMLSRFNETDQSNLLKGVKLKALNPLDEEYNDISVITDGYLGIPSNYHSGHLISTADPSLSIVVPRTPAMKSIRVWLTYNPAYRIGLPLEVIMLVGGREFNVTPRKPQRDTGHSFVDFRIPEVRGDIKLIFLRDPDEGSFAIEEIQAFPN